MMKKNGNKDYQHIVEAVQEAESSNHKSIRKISPGRAEMPQQIKGVSFSKPPRKLQHYK